jgi:hypothetical protein
MEGETEQNIAVTSYQLANSTAKHQKLFSDDDEVKGMLFSCVD